MLNWEKTESVITGRDRVVLSEKSLKPAAILMPYFIKDGKEHILLTVRSQQVPLHKGQIAFPGGRQEPGEDLETTALREAEEEVGIHPQDVELIGPTDDIVTITSYRVTPFLGKIPYPYEFNRNPEEIAEILLVPFEALLAEENITKNVVSSSIGEFPLYYFNWNSHVIWGATGRILANLLNLLYGKDL